MIPPILRQPVPVECAAPPPPARCRTSEPSGTAPTPRAPPRSDRQPPGRTGSALPGGRPWRFGRIVPAHPRRARRTNRGIMRKPAGASDGPARTILPERHFCARRPPRSPTPGPP